MNVGSLVYATDQGIGILAKQFYDNGVITHPVIVIHSQHPTHYEWYPPGTRCIPIRMLSHYRLELMEFCRSMDAMLFIETPFDWNLLRACKRSALLTMYECTPERVPAEPDVYICPSLLDLQHFPSGVHIPVPVTVPWRQRHRAEVFVHNAGHGSFHGRNGTQELVDAWSYIKSGAKLILRSQKPMLTPECANVELRVGTFPYGSLYDEGDVFVFPEKFNGLSLPMQEAYASGMPVIGTDRFPMNQWLPTKFLVQPIGFEDARIGGAYRKFSKANVSPFDIAKRVDEVYGTDISSYSLQGLVFAQTHSWPALRPLYMEALCG